MPSFCRHGRFIERCPICSKTLPGAEPVGGSPPRVRSGRGARSAGARGDGAARRRVRGEGMRVSREGRAEDDGFRSELVPGVHASADALRLVEEISFASGRLLTLAAEPPGLYGEARELVGGDLEGASWICFLIAYFSPLQDGEDTFAGIRSALAQVPVLPTEGELPSLAEIPLGPRTSHDPARGGQTLLAYGQWVARNGGTQAEAFVGDPGWSPERRFERLFERLALPGFGRVGRYELLVTLGRLGCYELQADSLHLSGGRGLAAGDPTTVAAKRVFGIGDELLLDKRAAALAEAAGVPVESLDLALANWGSGQRATVGVAGQTQDNGAYERAGAALGL
jgi:Alpha-glutamyl/putrescinyl thymine pyrophosphorylase clade 3